MFGQVALIYSSPWLSFTGNPDREEASSFYIKSLSAKGIFRTSCSVKKKKKETYENVADYFDLFK